MRRQQMAGLSRLAALDDPEGLKVLGSSAGQQPVGVAPHRPVLLRVLSQGVPRLTGIGAVDEVVRKEELVPEFLNHDTEVQQLRTLLDKECEISASLKIKLQEEHRLNESSLKELHYLKMEKEKEKEEMTRSLQCMEKTLKDAHAERLKTEEELAQMKQHLVDRELEKSKKMDMENKIIYELLANSEFQKSHIANLAKTLKLEVEKREEIERLKNDEVQKLNEVINSLNHKLAGCTYTINTQHTELLKFQIALGKCASGCEAKKSLEMVLALSREESAEISELLKVANKDVDKQNKETDEIFSRLSSTESMLSESKCTIQKLQEENLKLHQILEENMGKINGMPMDSEYLVDRRVVINLLVTYFQQNHSKEVLDVMVRMLGFTEEDKKKIGFAQEIHNGMAFGILGLPIRLFGAMFGGTSQVSPKETPEHQSIADLWVEFLLKEIDQGD